jgi:Na+-driven multidrug efflux pump
MAGLQYVISTRQQKTYLLMTVFLGLLSIGLNFVLIPLMQGEGAALAVVISQAIAAVIFIVVSIRHLNNQFEKSRL